MENKDLTPFEGANIRRVEHNGEMWFSIVDIISVLTESQRPQPYWSMLKKRDTQLITVCYALKMKAPDGKQRLTDCANTEGVLRIIQSVPSPKAEPFKMWLASLGKQAIDEANDPELLTERQAEIYRAKGYSDEWIKRRLQTIETRKELTDEWKNRGVKEGQEYSVLTATVAKGTFGMTPSEHAKMKNLDGQNLRDHMTPLELIFTALSEELTKQQVIKDDSQGFNENHDAAVKGGNLAGKYRKDAEKKGFKVLSKDNYLPKDEKEKELPPSDHEN